MSLYIVATPIGNLDDITFRAVEILKTVDVILAEDTRHSKRLMSHYDIATPMRAFHEHNETQKSAVMINELLAGKTMALISDAGTPLISDPGYVLVSEAKKSGVNVVPIPGPSAIISSTIQHRVLPVIDLGFLVFYPANNRHDSRPFKPLPTLTKPPFFTNRPNAF
jgi:Predicted methyltransferases